MAERSRRKKQAGDKPPSPPQTLLIASVAAKIFEGADVDELEDALAGLLWLCLDEPRFATPEARQQALGRIHSDALAMMDAWDKARARAEAAP
jgi:hypothetical protein